MPLMLLCMVIFAALWLFDARTSTTIVLVRAAESEHASSASQQLSTAGMRRADALQQLLMRAKPERGVDVVYVSDDTPAQKTAAPLAATMGLAVNVVATADWNSLLGRIMRDHAGEVALIVSNRDSLMSILGGTGAGNFVLDETDYGSVFVIVRSRLSKPSVIRLRY